MRVRAEGRVGRAISVFRLLSPFTPREKNAAPSRPSWDELTISAHHLQDKTVVVPWKHPKNLQTKQESSSTPTTPQRPPSASLHLLARSTGERVSRVTERVAIYLP